MIHDGFAESAKENCIFVADYMNVDYINKLLQLNCSRGLKPALYQYSFSLALTQNF